MSSLSGIGSSIPTSSNTNQGLSELGSAGRGHGLSLLDSLVSTEEVARSRKGKGKGKSKSQSKINVEGLSKASEVIQAELQKKEDTASLSLSALRAQKQSWTDLRISLEEIAKSQNLIKDENSKSDVDVDVKGKGKEISESSSKRNSLTTTPNDPNLSVHLSEEQIDQMKKAQLDQLKYDYATTDARLLDALLKEKITGPFLNGPDKRTKPNTNPTANQQGISRA